VDIVVDLQLWAMDRRYRLPGTGSRSMLFRFDEIEGQPMFGAAATASDGRDFRAWTELRPRPSLAPGDVEAHPTVEPGTRFVVWYGGDIGEGIVRSS
jgi:hypothetical protein